MKKIIFALLLVTIGFVSCQKDDHIPDPAANDQTLLIYMPWSTDLTSYFRNNLADFEQAIQQKGVLRNSRVVVFFSTSLTEASMFELKHENGKNTRTTLKEYTNPPFTTAGGITEILNDMKQFAPANRYAMAIGCHGKGWIPVASSSSRSIGQKSHWEYEGSLLTRFFGGRDSSCQTDITTLAEGILNAGMKMEYILFDDCYMSTIEVAYDLKDVTDYLIASPTEIMAYGFPYHLIGEHLLGDVDYAAVSEGFLSFYENYSLMPCGTIGITKCSELENMAAVMKEINQRFSFNTALLNSLQRLDGYSPVIFFDFGDYVAKLCTDEELLERFEEQLERTVPSQLRKHTRTYYTGIRGQQIVINAYSGITVSDPSVNSDAASKTETAWYKATH